MTLKEKLIAATDAKQKVEDIAKPLYEAWNEATAEAVQALIETKCEGRLPTTPVEIKFKTGEHFILKPEYMSKEGIYKNVVWKSAGAEMFSIKRVEK